jgi:hypothetical protein
MSDSNPPLDTKERAHASTPAQVIPRPARGPAKTASQPNGSPATGRKPLFRS